MIDGKTRSSFDDGPSLRAGTPNRSPERYSGAWVLGLCFIGWAVLFGLGKALWHLL